MALSVKEVKGRRNSVVYRIYNKKGLETPCEFRPSKKAFTAGYDRDAIDVSLASACFDMLVKTMET
jgi:hypothetical protein